MRHLRNELPLAGDERFNAISRGIEIADEVS